MMTLVLLTVAACVGVYGLTRYCWIQSAASRQRADDYEREMQRTLAEAATRRRQTEATTSRRLQTEAAEKIRRQTGAAELIRIQADEAERIRIQAEHDRVERRSHALLAQLPKTKAFKKVSMSDAVMAVVFVDTASGVIQGCRDESNSMPRVNALFDALVKRLKLPAHVTTTLIRVQGLNLKTGKINESEEALRHDIEADKEKRRRNWKKCDVCKVRAAVLKRDEPLSAKDVTHCVECADPGVHVHSFVHKDGGSKRVRLENVKPHKYACASLV